MFPDIRIFILKILATCGTGKNVDVKIWKK